MAATPYKFNTTASTNLQSVRSGQTANLKSIVASNSSAAAQCIKICWFTPTTATPTPIVGTTIPSLTFYVPATTGATALSFADGITGNGQMWVWVTAINTDADTTVTATGGVITLNVE